MKKILCALLVISLTAGICTACGKKEEGSDNKEGNKDGKTVIRYIDHFNEQTKIDGVTAAVEKFEAAYPEYKVEVTHTGSDNFLDQIRTAVAAGEPYDIFHGHLGDFVELVDAGEIYPLDDQPFIGRIDESVIENEKRDGKVWAMPMSRSIGGVYYNKKVFRDNDIKVPETRSEFIEACEKLKEAGIIPISGGYMQGNVVLDSVQWIGHPLWQNMDEKDINQRIMDGTGKFADSPAYLETLKNWNELILDYIDANELSVDRSERVVQLTQGKLGMLVSGSWSVGDIRTTAPDGEFGFIPIMNYEEPEKNGVVIANDDGFMVSAKGANLDGALAYLDFLTSPEGANAWLEKSKTVTALKGVKVESDEEMVTEIMSYIDAGQLYYAKDSVQFQGVKLSQIREVFKQYVSLPQSERKDYEASLHWLDEEFTALQ